MVSISQAYETVYGRPPPDRMNAAGDALRRAAGEMKYVNLGNVLRAIADGLSAHPDPIGLCERNAMALALALDTLDEKPDPKPTAVEVHIAWLALEGAAVILRGGPSHD